MGKIIGVQFQQNGKLYYFDANGFEPETGSYVIIDTARGYDLGAVVIGPREISEDTWSGPMKKTIRIATEQDIQHAMDNRQKEKEAFSICQKKIVEHKLEMKLVSVEYAFDNSKILFFFTANGRVDFRSLVKDLASIFKMRIELRQIGVRDEAKMLGGLGPCGRSICCGTFLDQFQPVSIKMAKEQNLSLNPTKISGVCGRLMCCLKYEQDHYEQTRRKMPRIGREVVTPDGNGPVTDLNIVKETVFVRLTNGDTSEIKEYPLESIIRADGHEQADAVRNVEYTNLESTENTDKDEYEDINIPDEEKGSKNKSDNSEPTPESKEPSVQTRGKNGRKSRKSTLGQPVMRENPNRKDQKAQSEQKTQPEKKTQQDRKTLQGKKNQQEKNQDVGQATESISNNSQPSVKQQNNWADALEKAMQAINQNK